MATTVTATGGTEAKVNPTKRQLRTWANQVKAGKRSKFEIERTELGLTKSRGVVLSRLFQSRLGETVSRTRTTV